MALIIGTAGDDNLVGTDEVDVISALAGDDRLNGGGPGIDRLDGGAGFDTVDIQLDNPRSGASVNFANGIIIGDPQATGTDVIFDIESIVGTYFDDVFDNSDYAIVGGKSNYGSFGLFNSVRPLSGNDVIQGNGSTALFLNANLETAPVNVSLQEGRAWGDWIGEKEVSGVNVIQGSRFDDNIVLGDPANDWYESYRATTGSDFIDGGTGYDRVEYDRIDVTDTGLFIDMGKGEVSGKFDGAVDTLRNTEAVRGSSYSDTYDARNYTPTSDNQGNSPNPWNHFEGAGGDDVIYGNGETTLRFDRALSGVYANTVEGVAYARDANANADIGTDEFSGVNVLIGSQHDDHLVGGNPEHDDYEAFRAQGGDDLVDGGSGWDLARYDSGNNWMISDGAVVFAVDEDGNRLYDEGINVSMAAGVVIGGQTHGNDTLLGIESVRGTPNDDYFDARGYGSNGANNVGSFGTRNEFEGVFGNDTIVGNGNTRVSFRTAHAGVTVNLAKGESYSSELPLKGTDKAFVGFDSFTGVNSVVGSAYSDIIIGSEQNEYFRAGNGGNDKIYGGGGRDVLLLRNVEDVVIGKTKGGQYYASIGDDQIDFFDISEIWINDITIVIEELEDTPETTDPADSETDEQAQSIQDFISSQVIPTFATAAGEAQPTAYSGNVDWLETEFIGDASSDVVIGSALNDFINLGAGDDAVEGLSGDDVLDAGLGSNFMTGGNGSDTFFIDGRGDGELTWSTITDFQSGDEVNIWGWRDGVSKLILARDDDGDEKFKGATFHYDLNGNGSIDTSITFTGLAVSDIADPTVQVVANEPYLWFI